MRISASLKSGTFEEKLLLSATVELRVEIDLIDVDGPFRSVRHAKIICAQLNARAGCSCRQNEHSFPTEMYPSKPEFILVVFTTPVKYKSCLPVLKF